MARAYYTVKKSGDKIVIRASDPDAKQTIWGWAGGGQPGGMEMYGTDVPGVGYGDNKLWEWKLSEAGVASLMKGLKLQQSEPKRYEASKKEKVCARELLAKMKKASKASGGKLDKYYHESFLEAYVKAALYSTNDESDPETGGEPMDRNYSWDNFAPKTKQAFKKDCDTFIKMGQRDLVAGLAHGMDAEKAGHDFWLTREGHGAGFWDGDWPEPMGKNLTALSKKFGEANIYVDGGKVYQMSRGLRDERIRGFGGKRRHAGAKKPSVSKLTRELGSMLRR
jgi:hypothetical protein